MKYTIVYWSRYGHGKKIVDSLGKKLKENKAEVKIFKTDEANPKKLPESDAYIFSAPAEAFRIQKNMRTFMKSLEDMGGKKYAIINTHAMKKKNWLKSMENMLNKKDMEKIAEVDFVISSEGQQTGQGLTDGWEKKLDEFASKL